MRRRVLTNGGGRIIGDKNLGNILLYDSVTGNKIFIEPNSLNATNFPLSRYNPLGVCVIPASHDVYGTGECAVISLVHMDYNTPEKGTTNTTALSSNSGYFYTYRTSNSSLYRSQEPYVGGLSYSYTDWNGDIGTTEWTIPEENNNSVGFLSITGGGGDSIFPSDSPYPAGTNSSGYEWIVVDCKHDANCKYWTGGSFARCGLGPSPYLTNGSRNPSFYKSYFYNNKENSACADFNGYENTKLLILENGSSTYNNNPFSCCALFCPKGTKKGDWFLPSAAELRYVNNRIGFIRKSFDKLISVYGNSNIVPLGYTYYSSTPIDSKTVIIMSLSTYGGGGFSYTDSTSYGDYARAFMRCGDVYRSRPNTDIKWTTQSGTWNQTTYSQAFDGKQFTCVSPGASESTVLRCTFNNLAGRTITFYCQSTGEEGCDYLTVGNLDQSCTRSNYKTKIDYSKASISYSISDNNTHYVEFCYSKDGSIDSSPDNATVFVFDVQ